MSNAEGACGQCGRTGDEFGRGFKMKSNGAAICGSCVSDLALLLDISDALDLENRSRYGGDGREMGDDEANEFLATLGPLGRRYSFADSVRGAMGKLDDAAD